MDRRDFLIFVHKGQFIELFLLEHIRLLQKMGFVVHCASNFKEEEDAHARSVLKELGVPVHPIDICRSPYEPGNLRAVRQLKSLLKQYPFAAIHCHTPTGGVFGRIAAREFRKRGMKVFYTAHGFHFYKGAPLKNWLLYYTAERLCARWTDALITINREDYERAKTFPAKRVYYMPGVGIDTSAFRASEGARCEKRAELGLRGEDFVLLSVGELIPRKNHQVVLEGISRLKNDALYARLHYVVCGRGVMMESLEERTAQLGLEGHVHFLGFRNDIADLCACSDLFVFMSLQEGLPVALMEAMCCGVPVVCSNIRGNTDLVENGVSGEVIDNDAESVASAIRDLARDEARRSNYASAARERIRRFDWKVVMKEVQRIYASELGSQGERIRDESIACPGLESLFRGGERRLSDHRNG